MSTPLQTAETASVAAADTGIAIVAGALDAAAMKAGPLGPWLTEVIADLESDAEAFVAKELPAVESKIVDGVKALLLKAEARVTALFHHAGPPPCVKGSAVDLLTVAELKVAVASLAGPMDVAAVELSPANTWFRQSIVDNKAAIIWKAHAVGAA